MVILGVLLFLAVTVQLGEPMGRHQLTSAGRETRRNLPLELKSGLESRSCSASVVGCTIFPEGTPLSANADRHTVVHTETVVMEFAPGKLLDGRA